VARLIDASSSLFQRTLLMVLYGTGMRRAEIARLKSPTSTASACSLVSPLARSAGKTGGQQFDLPMLEVAWAVSLPAFPACYVFVYGLDSLREGGVQRVSRYAADDWVHKPAGSHGDIPAQRDRFGFNVDAAILLDKTGCRIKLPDISVALAWR
jgi:hypothetical protein